MTAIQHQCNTRQSLAKAEKADLHGIVSQFINLEAQQRGDRRLGQLLQRIAGRKGKKFRVYDRHATDRVDIRGGNQPSVFIEPPLRSIATRSLSRVITR